MTILIDILIISLFCNGWYLITRPGMVFYFFHYKYLSLSDTMLRADGEYEFIPFVSKPKIILQFFYKPLFGCVTCYASIWGSLVYWIIDNNWIHYPIVIISSSCVNLLIKNIYDR